MRALYIACLSVFFSSASYGQGVEVGNKNLIIKIEFLHNSNSGDFIAQDDNVAYCILSPSLLDRIKIDTIFNEHPSIAYCLTKNGGYYLFKADDVYSYTCCELGDVASNIKDVMVNVDSVQLSKHSFWKTDNFSDLTYKNSRRKKYVVNNKHYSGQYLLSVWQADIKYCLCDIYMDRIRQPIYNNEVAYVKSVTGLSKPSKEITKKLFYFLQKSIE